MVVQDERQKAIKPVKVDAPVFQSTASSDGSTITASTENQAYAAAHTGYRPHQLPVCMQLCQTRHIMQRCFKLYGYPPRHRFYNANTQAPRPQQQASQLFAPRGSSNSVPRYSQSQSAPLQQSMRLPFAAQMTIVDTS